MWKIERDDEYFRIFDSKKDIAGYFDPDYGELFPKEKELELIEQMHKNHDKIPGGFFKREGRPSENETLTSRLIDRPIRPLFPAEFKPIFR